MKRFILAVAVLLAGALIVWVRQPLSAEDLGAREAARDASRARFAFRYGGLGEGGIFLGTPNCHVPPENDVRVTDAYFPSREEAKKFDRAVRFATSYNKYLVQHYPKQSAAICRR